MATIKELAKKAGVSPSTASIVMNGKAKERKISKETVKRVMETAREIGYTPNLSARILRGETQSEKYRIALFWTTDFRLTMMVKFLKGLQEEILSYDKPIELVIITYENGKLQEAATPNSLIQYHGAIICNANRNDLDYLKESTFSVPIILYNRFLENYSTVNIDNYKIGHMAANISLSNKRNNNILLNQEPHFPGIEARIAGFYDTLDKKVNVFTIVNEQNDGYEIAKTLHQKNQLPDFVFSLSDRAALGFINYLNEQKISIPKEIDIVAIGTIESEFYNISSVPLTTIDVPMEAMAKECLDLLVKRLKNPSEKLKTIIVPVEFNQRDSSLK